MYFLYIYKARVSYIYIYIYIYKWVTIIRANIYFMLKKKIKLHFLTYGYTHVSKIILFFKCLLNIFYY
jgi:hypothetical protein